MKSIREAPVVNKRTPASFLVGDDDDELTTCSKPMAQSSSSSTSESRNDQETTTTQRLSMEDPCRFIMEKVVDMDKCINDKQDVEEEEEEEVLADEMGSSPPREPTTGLPSILKEFGKEFPYQDESTSLLQLDHQPHLRHTPTSFSEEQSPLNKQHQPNERSPVSVAHVTDIHKPHDMDHHDDYHDDDYDSLSFPLDLPALLPELQDDDDDPCNLLVTSRKRSLDTFDSSTTRTESSSSSSSMFIAPRWDHERTRPKPEESTREESTSNPCHPTIPNSLEESHKNDNSSSSMSIHTPSLLEIAVGYGFHLARCRLEQEQNHCELSGILDPSRRIQDILQDGAQTVVRMKDEERRLFWKYMMMMNNANKTKDLESSTSPSSSSSSLL